MSLVAVLMTAAIAAMVMTFIIRTVQMGMDGSKSVGIKSEKESVRMMILGRVSCAKTFTPNPCTAAGTLVDVKNVANDIVIAATGTQLGEFTVRAECNATLNGVIVKATRLKPGAAVTTTASDDFLADPLTKRKVMWNEPAALLFGAGIEMCPYVEHGLDVHKVFVGVTPTAYKGNMGGWPGSSAKCEAAFGTGAVMCSSVQVENSLRAGLSPSMPAGEFWFASVKDHWYEHCKNWTTNDSSVHGNTVYIYPADEKIQVKNEHCDNTLKIFCCK